MERATTKEIAIVGTGFAGLGMAIRLKQAGMHDFVLLERADDLGGTWRDNHYPGLCCDIPSHVYSYSFELNPNWTRGFAPGWEIQGYLKRTAEKYDLLPHIRYGHELLEAAWDDDGNRWRIHTAGGDLSARVLVSAAGGLSEPSTPDLPGLERFRGKTFHSADWDHDHELSGERVAVIGTGASAIQFVPQIQPEVGRLHLFQRTPPWVMPRLDHEITDVEHKLLRRIPFAPRLVRWFLYWLLELRVLSFRNPRLMRLGARIAKKHLARQVPDPELRRKLTPDYVMGCKRVLVSDDYYPSLLQPNVEVVTAGVSEVRERSIVDSEGNEREVDTIIFGTGFVVADQPIAHRYRGRDGRTLAEHWQGGMEAYLGSTIAGFPNLFMLVGPNTGLGHNSIVLMIESQLNYVLDCLRLMRHRGVETVEVRPDVQRRFNDGLQRAMEGTVWTAGGCQSWYLDESGRNTTLWPGFTFDFRRRTRRFDPESYALADGSAPAVRSPARTVRS
jgi:cation diffusion facilitator CzcD-associated flavoprotein CzcO